MDQPLVKWYCDSCGDVIEDVNGGYVIWEHTREGKLRGFKIIHQSRCDRHDYRASAALRGFVGPDGLARLLAFLSDGRLRAKAGQVSRCDIEDMDEFVDFFRRVQTPLYEEARRLFKDTDLRIDYADANETLPYTQVELDRMLAKYKE